MADIDLKQFETDELLRGDGAACDWPLLSDWTAVRYGNDICLEGRVSGHPRLKDGGEIRTSALRRLTRDRAYAETQNTIYRLGDPASPAAEHLPDVLQLISSPDWDAAVPLLTAWTKPRAALSPLRCREALRQLRPVLPWSERRAIIAVISRELAAAGHHRLGDMWTIVGADPDEWISCKSACHVIRTAVAEWAGRRGYIDDATGRRIRRILDGWEELAKEDRIIARDLDPDPIRHARELGEMLATDENDIIKEEAIEREADLFVKSVPPVHQRQPEPAGPGVVVVPRIGGNAKDFRNRPTCEDFRPLEGRKLPLVPVPDLAQARTTLAAEFPHAAAQISIMLSDLVGRSGVTFKPTLLVSEQPGTAKSTLAARIGEIFSLYVARYDGAASNDSSFGGCARHWSTAEPSFPLAAVRDSGTSCPLVIVDEIDKATKSHNGGLAQSLLPFFGTMSAKYADIYIAAPVDLSHVSYILTANDELLLPKPLRDRLRILRIPTPTVDHLPILSAAIIRELSGAWAQPLDGDEQAIAAGLWPQGGSIRKLRAIIERILARRDEQAPRH